MVHSTNALNIIMQFEGLSLSTYKDANGIPTIGYGHTSHVEMGMTISKSQALLYLNADVMSSDVIINKMVTVPLTQNQFDALVSFVYNLGPIHFSSSTTLKDLNQRNYQAAADAMLMWVQPGSANTKGLTIRRNAERELFLRSA
ncbi:MAG: lysozyme [Janthinobacterium lividum]